eukprot:764308-Hanusia_phi.AAC.2
MQHSSSTSLGEPLVHPCSESCSQCNRQIRLVEVKRTSSCRKPRLDPQARALQAGHPGRDHRLHHEELSAPDLTCCTPSPLIVTCYSMLPCQLRLLRPSKPPPSQTTWATYPTHNITPPSECDVLFESSTRTLELTTTYRSTRRSWRLRCETHGGEEGRGGRNGWVDRSE